MPEFLAQSYVAHREEAVAAIHRARKIRSPRLLHAVLVPTDEIFLTFWRGPDADAVATAARNVGLGPDRVIRVEELSAAPGGTEAGRIRRAGRKVGGKLRNKSPAERPHGGLVGGRRRNAATGVAVSGWGGY